MEIAEFVALHGPALEADEVRHNLIIGLMTQAAGTPDHGARLWSLGRPGACALKSPGKERGIVLGDLDEGECAELARITAGLDYPSVMGQGETAGWFAKAARAHGLSFIEPPHAQCIQTLSRPPARPRVPGSARLATMDDADLVFAWTTAFSTEAAPDEPLPQRALAEKTIAEGRRFLWEVDGAAVSMAGIARRLKRAAAIAPVYTPPQFRACGFAGAVTAAVVDAIFARGWDTACLYTDLGNPAALRCYAKLGFTPLCDSFVYVREA